MPKLIPGLEEFWAPGEDTPETMAKEVEGDPHFALGHRAKYPRGVVYNGPWETLNDGVCVAVRRNACALRRQGVPVFLSSLTHTNWNRGVVQRTFHHELPPAVLAEVDHLTACEHDSTVCRILHFVPTTGFLIQNRRGSLNSSEVAQVLMSRTIAYMALEYDRFPEAWVRAFNLFGRIAVPCQKNRVDLIASGVKRPIDVIPHPMALKDPMRNVRSAHVGGPVRFLHVGKWEPRKNQHVLLGAFLLAFEPDDPVELTLHCKPFWGAPGYPATPEESRYHWLEQDFAKSRGWNRETFAQRVHFNWATTFTRDEMCELYRGHHVYVSSARAEGFDLCAFDAKVAGLRMVHVGNGGPSDFATPTDIQVAWKLRTAPPTEYNTPQGTTWPEPTLDAYARALKRACRDVQSGAPPIEFDAGRFKIDAVGRQLLASVQALIAEHDIPPLEAHAL